MSQPTYSYTSFGSQTTSTGSVTISTGSTIVHSINILSSGTGSVTFYNATASSTGSLATVHTVGTPAHFILDVVFAGGLTRGHTTSTAEVVVAWG